MTHSFVTIAVPFPTEKATAVQKVLDELGNPALAGPREALDATGVIHFMSLSAVADTAPGTAHFFLEMSADGGPDDALASVCNAVGSTIERALEVAGLNPDAKPITKFLGRYELTLGPGLLQTTGVGFAGATDFSISRIHQEAGLANDIMATMQDVLRADLPAPLKLDKVRERLWAQDQKWAFTAAPAPFLNPGGATTIPARIWMALIALVKFCWPLLIVPIGLFCWLGIWPALGLSALLAILGAILVVRHLRYLETTDPVDDSNPNAAKVEAILRHENTGAQNLLAAVSVVKPGLFRRVVLKLAFAIAVQDIAHLFRPGYLREIGVIHFARWALIPGTDKLMFWSNFSDGWESYIEDFIEKAGDGLTAIWSNTIGFPRTSFLIMGGAADGDQFRRWARRQQYPVSFWYSAYPELKMNRIRRNAAIRQGISGARTTAEAEDWISLFGSEPRPPFMLEKQEIPTLVLGGLKRMRYSTCLVIRLPGVAAKAQAWLREVAPSITFGEAGRDERAASIAFSAHGLTRLDVAETDLATFPVAFQNGMTAPGRSQALGDLGIHAPEHWLWGKVEETDALLVLYETKPQRLAQTIKLVRDGLAKHGGAIVFTQPLADRPTDPSAQVHEPFGFADGMSQPILRDSPRARMASNAGQIVEAGEFLFGYPDNRGYIPPTPTVSAKNDPNGLLAEYGAETTGVPASIQGGGSSGQRDFGLNGTFLAARHLEQDVKAFHDFNASQASLLSGEVGCPFAGQDTSSLQTLLEAKMLGRWHNGHSLVRNPYPDSGHSIDNDFDYVREDPQGFACPFGAHIRRANPRDSIDMDSSNQLTLSNRHRILRVGRPYPTPKSGNPGMMFLCLNADIERQFEFLQQTWVLGATFHDLQNERDPFIGHNSGTGVYTIPTRQGPVQLRGLPDFVRVRGGGYFFMPGRRSLMYLASDKKARQPVNLPPPAAPIGSAIAKRRARLKSSV